MAIIRQKTQVFNQPIGVVRADASDEAVGLAVSRAASDFANLAYREATLVAEQAGQEAAGAQSRENIVTIDPTTGRPTAYKPPSNFGRIAARSYQNMIDRRFEESINEELQARAAEIAENSTSANGYRDRMSAYVQEMYANAVDESGELNNYGRYIQETGTAYIASTYATMREREAQAAREALVRQQNLAEFFSHQQIGEMIRLGGDPEEITRSIESEHQRNLDLYQNGERTISEFGRRFNELNGFTSQIADSRLSNLYSSLSADDPMRPRILAAVRNPSVAPDVARQLGRPDFLEILNDALIDGSPESLGSMLEAQARYEAEYEESATEQYYRDLDITPNTTYSQLQDQLSSVPAEFRSQVEVEAMGQWVENQIDIGVVDVTQMDSVLEELRNTGEVDFTVVADLAGPEVARAVMNMSQEQRNGLATNLGDRRSQLESLRSEGRAQLEDDLRGAVRQSKRNGTLAEDYETLLSNIENSGLLEPKINTLTEMLNRTFAQSRLDDARTSGRLSANAMARIRSAVRAGGQLSESALASLTDAERGAYEAYRDAYSIDPSSADSEMGRRLTGLQDAAADQVSALRIDLVNTAMENLQGVSDADLAFVDEQLFGDLGPINASAVITMTNADGVNPILSAADKGYVFPTLVRAIETGLMSRNENDMAAAMQLFEIYTNLEAEVEGGRAQPLDILRRHLSEETYGMYSAISIIAREEQRAPLDIMLELQALEESPDALIRRDLGLAQNSSLNSLFAEYPMSSNYREEILAMMRIRRARGMQFNQDTVDQIISDYTEKQTGLRRDDAVMAPYIGDETVYARTNYFTVGQIIENKNELIDLMAEDPNLRNLLQGGTALDQTIRGVFGLLGGDIEQRFFAAIESISPQMFGFDSIEEMNDRDRVNAGLQILGIDLKYQPVMESFREGGLATYRLGYELNGSFQPITINGEPYLLQQTPESSDSFELLQATNNLSAARAGGDPMEIRRAEFVYTRARDYLTPQQLREAYPEFAEEIDNAD